jgi:LAO/AO transport system kinase
VVLMPGLGDEVQAIKAGIMEIGDVFVINKADREGADRFEQQITAMLALSPERDGWRPPVQRTVATEDKGIGELAAHVAAFRAHLDSSGARRARTIGRWKQRLLELIQARLTERVVGEQLGERGLEALADDVAARRRDPYAAVSEVLARAGIS